MYIEEEVNYRKAPFKVLTLANVDIVGVYGVSWMNAASNYILSFHGV